MELSKEDLKRINQQYSKCKGCDSFHYNSDGCSHPKKWESCYPKDLVEKIKAYNRTHGYLPPSEPGTRSSFSVSTPQRDD